MIRILLLLLLVAGCTKKQVPPPAIEVFPEIAEEINEPQEENIPEPVEFMRLVEKIKVNEKVLFDFNSDKLKECSIEIIDNILHKLQDNFGIKITLKGKACDIGEDIYNYRLGLRRGNSVSNYINSRGYYNTIITSVGESEQDPGGRELNRCCIITVE